MTLAAGTRLGPYEILGPLGAGGMGEVYRARDPRLGRDVAIKVLPASFSADPERLRRFEQEARAAGILNHPNITAVYDIGTNESDGAPYVVQELLEGESLRGVLGSGALSPRKALDHALQIAHGLAAAHEKGIVHRDLKPENIFVTRDGRVKILDFGLAKLTRLETEGSPPTQAPTATAGTEPGVVMGTVGYMSPEQVRGHPADPRSDIFSFGAILYEMLSGERAFRGDSAADAMSAILTKDPPDLSPANRHIAPGLERVVRHCLEKNSEQRFQSAHDLAFDLEALSDVSKPTLAPAGPRAITRPGARVLLWVAGVAALAAAVLWLRPGARTIDSLAVLPFVNAGGDPNTEYLSDGITESLINSVSQIPGVKVISRASAFHYKGKDVGARTVGRELGVRAVLTGRIVQHGDALSIRAELVDARDDTHVWGEEYNRRLSDILVVQEEITRDISGKLRQRLTGVEKKRLTRRYTENAEAYGLYLRGRYYWNKRTGEDLQTGIEYFQQAIARDPTYALAYVGLADCYAILFNYTGLASSETLPKAKAAALKALEIDDTLAQAHATLAVTHEMFDWEYPAAEKEFRRAIELDPEYPTAHHWYSLFLSALGRHEEAAAEAERALEFDPLSPIIINLRAFVSYHARLYDRAIEASRKSIALDKNFSVSQLSLGLSLEQKKMYPESIAAFEEVVRLSGRWIQAVAALGHALAISDRQEEALQLIEELKGRSERGQDSLVNIALVYTGLGRNDEAMIWLEKAYRARSAWLVQLSLKVDPRWDPLRSDARFQDLLRRIGFAS